MATPPTSAREPLSVRKRHAIVDAATTLFLRQGYAGTSMDAIAKLAAVSKQTVYKHFADKQRLFSEVVSATVDEVADPVHDEVLGLEATDNLEAGLRELARRQLESVMQPQVLQLRRLVISEAGRFPELGRSFYEHGAGRTIAALARAFERLTERRLLETDDPELAAAHFNWLVMSAPVNQAMLLGTDGPLAPEEIDRHASGGVRAFLAAYGRH